MNVQYIIIRQFDSNCCQTLVRLFRLSIKTELLLNFVVSKPRHSVEKSIPDITNDRANHLMSLLYTCAVQLTKPRLILSSYRKAPLFQSHQSRRRRNATQFPDKPPRQQTPACFDDGNCASATPSNWQPFPGVTESTRCLLDLLVIVVPGTMVIGHKPSKG